MDPVTAGGSLEGAIQFVSQVGDSIRTVRNNVSDVAKYVKTGSLIDITKMARVEPICIIDADVVNLDYTTDILQSMQSIFAGYYLQAIALTGNIGSISIASRLAPLNPNRDTIFESRKPDIRLASDAYKYCLPTLKSKSKISLEATNPVGNSNDKLIDPDVIDDGKILGYDIISKNGDVRMGDSGKDTNKSIVELTNLSVGKVYDVRLCDGKENEANIKIAIRLMVNSLPTASLINMLTFKDQFDMDMKERYHAWRAGRLNFIKDLILCRDLIDKHRTALVKDKSDIYQNIINRENNNFKAGLFNKNPSLATASNLVVMSSDTVAMMEQKLGGKFTQFKSRQHIFENTNLMIVAVVDKEWERITWFSRGIQEHTTTSVRDLKVGNKNNDNVMDIMKAFMAGSNPHM